MDIHFVPATFSNIHQALQNHLATLPSHIDSFLEDHILASQHYHIIIANQLAGFASVHHESLITQFALSTLYKQYGQSVFQKLRRLEQVQAAFVPTCDEFFLAHALDEYRQITKQAYFFSVSHPIQSRTKMSSCVLRLATNGDHAFIQQHTDEFFAPIEHHIEAQELFLVQLGDECVGFGLLNTSHVYRDVGSIGMYTLERFRGKGVATATITLLIEECQRRGLHAVAGCWYYNHASKKTLERAGMFTQTRLLKIDY